MLDVIGIVDVGDIIQILVVIAASPLLSIPYNWYKNREPGLEYKIKSVSPLKPFMEQYSKLDATYQGKLVEHLALTKIIIFNRSGKTIEHTDIANEKGVDINVQGEILEVSLTGKISNGCDFDLKKSTEDKKNLMLTFHHMKNKTAALVEILHSSDSFDFKNPFLTAAGAKVREISKNQNFGGASYIPALYTFIMLFLFSMIVVLFSESKTFEDLVLWLDWSTAILLAAIVLFVLLGAAIILISVSAVNSFLFNKKWISDLIKQFDQKMIIELKEEEPQKESEKKIFRLISKRLIQKLKIGRADNV